MTTINQEGLIIFNFFNFLIIRMYVFKQVIKTSGECHSCQVYIRVHIHDLLRYLYGFLQLSLMCRLSFFPRIMSLQKKNGNTFTGRFKGFTDNRVNQFTVIITLQLPRYFIIQE